MTNKDRLKSGVYKITIGEHFYIGSSQDVYLRKSSHLSKLKLKKHPNNYMQNVYNKYGVENFVFCVLEYCDVKDLIIKEQFYIDKLNPDLNHRLVAESNRGYKHTEQAKMRMKKAYKNRTISEETRRKMSESKKGSLNPNYKKPMSEKMKEILRNVNKNNKRLVGRKLSKETTQKMSLRQKGIKKKRSKQVYQYNKQGELIKIWDCVFYASKELGISSTAIYNNLKLLTKSSGGFVWKYN